jgi:alkyl sulfatase BDS1-like metallo-beta-lactamase superfamily hydrolase
MNWEKLKTEKKLASKNIGVHVPFPVIYRKITLQAVWNLNRYSFLLQEQLPDTLHPKLWEKGKLNLHSGFFKVTEHIYQVRGFDLANMSVVKGKAGWIVINCLTSPHQEILYLLSIRVDGI